MILNMFRSVIFIVSNDHDLTLQSYELTVFLLRFGNSYVGRVANHGDILLFKRRVAERKIKVNCPQFIVQEEGS